MKLLLALTALPLILCHPGVGFSSLRPKKDRFPMFMELPKDAQELVVSKLQKADLAGLSKTSKYGRSLSRWHLRDERLQTACPDVYSQVTDVSDSEKPHLQLLPNCLAALNYWCSAEIERKGRFSGPFMVDAYFFRHDFQEHSHRWTMTDPIETGCIRLEKIHLTGLSWINIQDLFKKLEPSFENLVTFEVLVGPNSIREVLYYLPKMKNLRELLVRFDKTVTDSEVHQILLQATTLPNLQSISFSCWGIRNCFTGNLEEVLKKCALKQIQLEQVEMYYYEIGPWTSIVGPEDQPSALNHVREVIRKYNTQYQTAD